MKRVSKDCIVVDHDDNSVGFVSADTLAIIAKENYGAQGYLVGAMGVNKDSKDHIYLWFSSREILLVDAKSF